MQRKSKKRITTRTAIQLQSLLTFLPRRRLAELFLLLGLSVFLGLFDIASVALLARLAGAITGSKLPDALPNIRFFGGDPSDQLPWMVLMIIALVWLSSVLKYCTLVFQGRITSQVWCDYGNLMYKNILYQPYEFFQNVTSASIVARLNRIISRISDDTILPLLLIASNAVTVMMIAAGVLAFLGWKALLVFVALILAYALVSAPLVPRLRLASKQRILFNKRISGLLLESIRSIREVNLYSAEPQFMAGFQNIGLTGKQYDRLEKRLVDIPRYVIEPAAVTILFAVSLLPPLLSGDMEEVRQSMPIIAAIMFALLKLSAPVQAIFRALNKFRGSLPEIEDALELLRLRPTRLDWHADSFITTEGLMPQRSIKLDRICFRYQQSERWVLDEVSITIPVGSRVALVGASGGGKTTIAHVILGLLTPQQGSVCLDGIPLLEREIPRWQSCCAMVPQDIVLLDSSVKANVAFSVFGDEDDIDDERVWEALTAAQLNDFVAELPYGIYTFIGENGVRLSGGQRQRLSLARAFYKNAKLLILDEATSALDNKTENDVLGALELIGRRCTTVVIAHRLSTVRSCDRIYELEAGRVKAHGSFEELQRLSESFRTLVRLDRG